MRNQMLKDLPAEQFGSLQDGGHEFPFSQSMVRPIRSGSTFLASARNLGLLSLTCGSQTSMLSPPLWRFFTRRYGRLLMVLVRYRRVPWFCCRLAVARR